MTCPACSATVSPTNRFCTQCGSPVPGGAAALDQASDGLDRIGLRSAGAAQAGGPARPAGDPAPTTLLDDAGASRSGSGGTADGTGLSTSGAGPDVLSRGGARTAVLPAMPADAGTGEGPAERVSVASRRLAGWFGSAAFEVRLAVVGAGVTVLGFLLLPYAVNAGTGASVGGRVWWRPLLAVLAAVLVALALRRERSTGGDQTPLVVAVAAAAIAATEAGLIGLVSGRTPNLRIGYYVILLGTTVVLVAAVLAARRCDRLGRAHLDA